MNPRTSILASCLLFLISNTACTPKRPETASYFKEVTGLSICESATIKNAKQGGHDHESEPIYQVIIVADEKCLLELNDQIAEKFDVSCDLPDSNGCTFTDQKSNWYKIEKNSDGSLLFRLSFT